MLSPLCRLILTIDQPVVPLAVPEPPLLLLHITLVTSVLSEAVPLRLIVFCVEVYVAAEAGELMVMVGAVVSVFGGGSFQLPIMEPR